MDSQLTLRLPRELARELSRRARARGVAKSQLVREAVARYISEPEPLTDADFLSRVTSFIGSLEGDQKAMAADPIARRMHDHNFRD